MKGFVIGVLILTSLDVILNAPATRLTAFMATPTRWLAQWMDPGTPLITVDKSANPPISAAPGSPVNPAPGGNPPLPPFNLGPIHLPIL